MHTKNGHIEAFECSKTQILDQISLKYILSQNQQQNIMKMDKDCLQYTIVPSIQSPSTNLKSKI